MAPLANEQGLKRDVIVIGASAGGVDALKHLCSMIPADFPGIIGVVLHRSPMYQVDVEALYTVPGKIRVREASHAQPMEEATLYMAPRDRHMLFHRDVIELSHGPKEHFTRPAVDPLFVSAASSFGNRVVGILLTGGGTDGVRGMVSIKVAQGYTIVQDPREAKNPSMPVHAMRDDHIDRMATLAELPWLMLALAQGTSVSA